MKYFFHIVLFFCPIFLLNYSFGSTAEFYLEIIDPNAPVTPTTPTYNTWGGWSIGNRSLVGTTTIDHVDLPDNTTDQKQDEDGDITIITDNPHPETKQEINLINPYDEEITITILTTSPPSIEKSENIEEVGIVRVLPPNTEEKVVISLNSAPTEESWVQNIIITWVTESGEEKDFQDIYIYTDLGDNPISLSAIEKTSESIQRIDDTISIASSYQNTSNTPILVRYEIYGRDIFLDGLVDETQIRSSTFYALPDKAVGINNILDTAWFWFPIRTSIYLIHTDDQGIDHIISSSEEIIWHLSGYIWIILGGSLIGVLSWILFGFWYWSSYVCPRKTTLREIIRIWRYPKKRILRKNKKLQLDTILKKNDKIHLPRWKQKPEL